MWSRRRLERSSVRRGLPDGVNGVAARTNVVSLDVSWYHICRVPSARIQPSSGRREVHILVVQQSTTPPAGRHGAEPGRGRRRRRHDSTTNDDRLSISADCCRSTADDTRVLFDV